jgi:hypothetical protein
VDLVIKDPPYQYSPLLISSIPMPDMNERWDDDPPLFRTDERAAACFLYQGVPTVDGAGMDQVLVTTAPAAEPTA